MSALSDLVEARLPEADFDQRDPDYIREMLPGAWVLASIWHRAEVRGLANIPEDGPVLLVGNHSGGNLSPDTTVFTLAFTSYFGVERPFYQLAHNLVTVAPGLGTFLRRFGALPASHENAEKALGAGAAVLVYPGGDWEVHRPSWQSGRIDFGGRTGFLRLAAHMGVPIVPVVSHGGQHTALVLTRGEGLARRLGLDRAFRLKVLPISVVVPWGVTVGDLVPRWSFPAKITIEVLPPLDVRERFGEDPDLDAAYDAVTGEMQDALDSLVAERRLPLPGRS
ncbi:MAG TPA: lysophospholipid acyltransferase family protein [Acidimicrobiales bacterium]|nr:lysophospholipid acyltransferase family protein [Acidimicrobiales bacterium]